MAVITGVLALFFVLATQFIYDYRENLAKVRELASLRHRVSEQNLTLYNLYAKFESLETEVERIRTLDARVRSLVNINEALLPGKRKTAVTYGDRGSGNARDLWEKPPGQPPRSSVRPAEGIPPGGREKPRGPMRKA